MKKTSIAAVALCLSLLVGCSEQQAEMTTNTTMETTSVEVQTEDKEESDFKHEIRQIVKTREGLNQKHLDMQEEARLKGAFAAYKMNLGMYKTVYGVTSFKYRVYYYAVNGQAAYLEEFGYDQKYIDDVEEFFNEISED